MLGYMPNRDDFEDFDKANEGLVSQIGVKVNMQALQRSLIRK